MQAPKHWINITETSAKHHSSATNSSSQTATISSQPQTLPQTSHINQFPEYFWGFTTIVLLVLLAFRLLFKRRGD